MKSCVEICVEICVKICVNKCVNTKPFNFIHSKTSFCSHIFSRKFQAEFSRRFSRRLLGIWPDMPPCIGSGVVPMRADAIGSRHAGKCPPPQMRLTLVNWHVYSQGFLMAFPFCFTQTQNKHFQQKRHCFCSCRGSAAHP